MKFADTNVLIDVRDLASPWRAWSSEQVARAVAAEGLCTNLIVCAELAVRFEAFADLSLWLERRGMDIVPIDLATAYRAGRAFAQYRIRGGPRTSIIPDFLIGAHAAVLGIPLITRDPRRFASYFPDLAIISPETHP